MAVVIRMPKMSDTMTEGVIVSWNKKVGDVVKPGDILADVDTDKATMELENFEKGTLLYIGIKEGQAVPIDAVIAIVGAPGEDYSALLDAPKAEAPKTDAPSAEKPKEDTKTETPKTEATPPTKASPEIKEAEVVSSKVTNDDARVKASPLAKSIAREKGIALNTLTGSGENGRIVKRDLENLQQVPATQNKSTAVSAGSFITESFEEIPVSQMRKTIARRLLESKNGAPHFYLTIDINMDKVIESRKSINANGDYKISINDFIVKACAEALTKHPMVNGSWLGDKIRLNHHVNIGVAIAVEDGLLVPVVRFANTKKLSQISKEVKEFSQKAKDKKLQPTDWEGNTFSISNLGMFGIEEFTAIINPPDSCILAVGATRETVIVKHGEFLVANMMKVTMSCDHRVVDGATGAAFLKTLKELLEDPIRIIL
jgi:pyruvate dehydrogenase E2 component (dihydrolipoamide acetyltransferase)